MNTAFVSLGSNLGDTQAHLAKACLALNSLHGVQLEAVSPLYFTEPQGVREQPWFVNQVVQLACDSCWQGGTFLQALLTVETQLGRVRSVDTQRYGPRCIDIDLLLFGDERLDTPECQLPHSQMHRRAFVLVPLRDIAPQVTIAGATVDKLLQNLTYFVEGQRILQ